MRPADTAMAAGELDADAIFRLVADGAWTKELLDAFKAEIRRVPDADDTDKALLALCDLALRGLDGPNGESERLLREWLKKSAAHSPEIKEYKGGYQPFLERATREHLASIGATHGEQEK